MKRAIIIVLDSVGMGELPDAAKYGDEGSNTLEILQRIYLILVCQILSLWDWEILTV